MCLHTRVGVEKSVLNGLRDRVQGVVGLGKAGRGLARPGAARQGVVGQGRDASFFLMCKARHGAARRGTVRQGLAG